MRQIEVRDTDVAHNDLVSEPFEEEPPPTLGSGPGPMNRQWLLAAAGGLVVVFIIAAAGIASIWDKDPKLEDRPAGPPPPREYGGPLWFTVGGPTETQLVTNTLPRGVAGPGSPYTGVATYLSEHQCFTDGTNLLVWPRGSRPLIQDGRVGVNPTDGVEIYDGDSFTATAESVVVAETEEFPDTPTACAPSGNALSLSAVSAS